MALSVLYNGRDITPYVSINSAMIDLSLSSFSDNGSIIFNNAEKKWNDYDVDIYKDSIELKSNNGSLGSMSIKSFCVSAGYVSMDIGNAPVQRQFSATYKSATLQSILSDAAGKCGLSASYFGDFSVVFPWLTVEKESVFSFISRLSSLFSFEYFLSKDTMNFFSLDYIRNQPVSNTIYIDDGYIYGYSKIRKKRKCIVTNGSASGESEGDEGDGEERIVYGGKADKALLDSIAKQNILGFKSETANVRLGGLERDDSVLHYSGSKIRIECNSVESEDNRINGEWIVFRNRIDFSKNTQSLSLYRY